MMHSHTSRNYAKAFFAFLAIGLASACADSIVAPTGEVTFTAPAEFSRRVGVRVFKVDRYGTTQKIGSHTISIPAGAICDPALSSYGPGEWDKPCTPLSKPIVITATMLEDAQGNPYVDFQPALRFVPTKTVNLYLRSGKTDRPREMTIKFCDNLGVCIDESLTDPSLVTQRVGKSSLLVRRIKHFSGYSINVGDECPGTVTEELDGTLMCWEGTVERRSGYMVASGVTATGKPDTTSTGGKKWVE
jgi:hypothetical protein